VENSFGKISGRDIHKLQRGQWLNDEIINYYMEMIKARSNAPQKVIKTASSQGNFKFPRIHVFNTFFYSMLARKGYNGVRRWTKRAKVNLFEMNRVLIPINKGGFHWILVVANIDKKRVEYYDSMGREGVSSDNRPFLQNVRQFMEEEAKALNEDVEDVKNWSFYVPVYSLET
jgi:sentrin-specific protease 1